MPHFWPVIRPLSKGPQVEAGARIFCHALQVFRPGSAARDRIELACIQVFS